MKIITFKKATFALASLLVSMVGYSQTHVTMSMKNITSTLNSIEYDLYIVNDGTNPIRLAACSYGVNFNPSIIKNDQLSFKYNAQSRVRALDGLKPYSIGTIMKGERNQVRIISTPIELKNAPELQINTPFKIGHFIIQCQHAWTYNSQPNFELQAITQPGLTTTQVLVYENDRSTIVALTPSTKNVQLVVEGNPILNPIESNDEAILAANLVHQSDNHSMHTLTEATLNVFPNPASHQLHLDLNGMQSSRIHISISDFQGRMVKQILTDIHSGLNQILLDVSELANGIYSINVKDDATLNLHQTFAKQ